MAVLLIAEISDGELAVDSTAKALTAAKAMGAVTVLVAGSGCQNVANAAAKLDGVTKVLCASHEDHANGLAEPLSDLIFIF